MTPERWQRVKEVFLSAIDEGPEAREAFVRVAAGDDAELCAEVLALLLRDSEETDFESPLSLVPASEMKQEDPARTMPVVVPEERIGSYQLLEIIGSGGMGTVYRACDSRRGQFVALKTLSRTGAATLYRFKQEFRTFADLNHPNLVSLYELVSDGHRWAFTMELVKGRHFLNYLAHAAETSAPGAVARLDCLHDVFAQLASGVAALHAAGKLHRDIKPSNVLVTPERRVVVLDFGLGAELDPIGVHLTTDEHRWGSIAYMSPEHASRGALSVASDWYSVGVMLFEALTGRLPFEGSPLEILDAKRTREADPPSAFDSNLPPELSALCVELLRRDPTERPPASSILARLGARLEPARLAGARPRRSRDVPFVGRQAELAALRDAYRTLQNRVPVVTYIHGDSGAGKSALVQRFLDEIASDGAPPVILTGRCHEQESVPFKALDSLVDSIARYLRHLPVIEIHAVLPRDIRALARLFPVFWQLPAVSDAPAVGASVVDPQELRRRAALALRELLARLGDRHPLVLFIDDLHWGDMDSASLLTDILTPPDPPVLLGIGCYRTEDAAASPFFQYLREARTRTPGAYEERQVPLRRLLPDETRELTYQLLETRNARADRIADAVVRESAGRPFLVYELIEHVKASADGVDSPQTLTLDEVLWRRVERLPEGGRRLLELVAVAGRPIETRLACQAAGVTGDERSVLSALRVGRFIRGATAGASEWIETYHDRVRESVLDHLSPAAIGEHHSRLAKTFSASRRVDPEVLAFHLDHAGEHEEAATYYAQAAAAAADALAFDHAAALFRRTLDVKAWSVAERCALRTRLGNALSNAGRGADAAAEYLLAAGDAGGADGLELQRRAALELLTSGHVDQGLAALGPVMKSVGTRLASAPWRALVSLLARRLQLRLRGIGFVERSEASIDAAQLQRIDIGWSVVVGLSVIDPIRGADFQTRSLLLALRAGEPFRVARALAVEAGHVASSGANSRAQMILGEAERLAARLRHPYADGIVELARGTVAYFGERWNDAFRSCRDAAAAFREHCTGTTWEIDTATAFSLWSLTKMGEIAELNRTCPSLLKEAHERGDLYAEANLGTQIMALVRLAAHDADGAREQLERVMQLWSQNGYHVQHHDALLAFVPLELYCGKPERAWKRIQEEWSAFRWSLLSHVQDLRIEMLLLRAYCALAMSTTARNPEEFLAVAARDARRLRRERLPWTVALADYIAGTIAFSRGDRATSRDLLLAAVSGFDDVDAHLYAAATRLRAASVIGGDDGDVLRNAADSWFAQQTVKRPDRMTAAFAPGFPE